MAKLYFRHGTVGSAKTLNLLAVAHKYDQQGKKVILAKPALDVRFGTDWVCSRAGLKRRADLLLEADSNLDLEIFDGVSCFLVDEAQFLSAAVIDECRSLTRLLNIPVICYGLRTDFRTKAFEGSARLLELADSIEEIKTTCAFCNKKAVFNLKHRNDVATVDGPQVDLGAEEKYYPVCNSCYHQQLSDSEKNKNAHEHAA
jgi:thymidine kinase